MLKDRKLTYYKSEKELEQHAASTVTPKGIINFDIIKADVHIVDERHFK